jgi:hypothetical protein
VTDVIIDTGTSFILVPDDDFYAITALISKNNTCEQLGPLYSNLFVCLCSYPEYVKFPDISFYIDDQLITLTRENYLYFADN